MKKQMHLAAQYLAAAGISFVAKKEDDSHTNLGFDVPNCYMYTHPLSEAGDRLTLNYSTFSIDWILGKEKTTFSLNGKSHKEVVAWISETASAKLDRPYIYGFHYELPYTIDDNFVFKLDALKLKKLLQLRLVSQIALQQVVDEQKIISDVRVWPHHFDTGAFHVSEISIGFGMAPPDSLTENHYLYVSGYKGQDAVDVSNFAPLTLGEWKNDGFKGAILSANKLSLEETKQFFTKAIDYYKKI
jgi:hypothetical protein